MTENMNPAAQAAQAHGAANEAPQSTIISNQEITPEITASILEKANAIRQEKGIKRIYPIVIVGDEFDEKPLYVEVDSEMNIKAFRDAAFEGARYISGGVYALNDKAIAVLEDCMSRGVSRMRNFQRALIDAGLNLKAYSIEKIVDVDHAGDIEVAERFLRGE